MYPFLDLLKHRWWYPSLANPEPHPSRNVVNTKPNSICWVHITGHSFQAAVLSDVLFLCASFCDFLLVDDCC